jgi:hypothetical protein
VPRSRSRESRPQGNYDKSGGGVYSRGRYSFDGYRDRDGGGFDGGSSNQQNNDLSLLSECDREIEAVIEDIKKTDDKIAELERNLLTGSKENEEFLKTRIVQLSEKERLLREKENMLREKELLVSKEKSFIACK